MVADNLNAGADASSPQNPQNPQNPQPGAAPRAHISVILDRTGSMSSIREDTIGGFNSFLAQQQSATACTTLTLVQFDSQDPFEVVHQFAPIAQVPPLTPETYVPRSQTPLHDAIGRGIIDLGARLAALPAATRPERVVFVIVTDGHENASREFTGAQVRGMIETHRKAGWQFVFLSADETAIADGRGVNVDRDFSFAVAKNSAGSRRMWKAVANRAALYCAEETRDMSFVDEKARIAEEERAERESRRGQPGQ